MQILKTKIAEDTVPTSGRRIDALSVTLSKWLQEARDMAGRDPQTVESRLHQLESLLAEYGGVRREPPKAPLATGGLAPWQVTRVKKHIEANLASRLTTAALAALVDLSENHFARAFKTSLGCPPHAYVVNRRVHHAKTLMLESDMPLSQVALAAGLADQAHLSRLFRRYFGETPSSWRRQHRAPPRLRIGRDPVELRAE